MHRTDVFSDEVYIDSQVVLLYLFHPDKKKLYNAPETAGSVLEALNQRLAKYKEAEQMAKEENNASKMKRQARIVKVHEKLIGKYFWWRKLVSDRDPNGCLVSEMTLTVRGRGGDGVTNIVFGRMKHFWSMYCIVLYLYIYIALLAVHTNQKRFQCERPREKRAVLRERKVYSLV